MVQATEAEARLESFGEREVGVELRAMHPVGPIVGIHDDQYFVLVGHEAVIVFIPHRHNRVAATFPRRGVVDRLHNRS